MLAYVNDRLGYFVLQLFNINFGTLAHKNTTEIFKKYETYKSL